MFDNGFIKRIQEALNTEECGDELIEVARNAYKAELALSAFKGRINSGWTFEGAYYAMLAKEKLLK